MAYTAKPIVSWRYTADNLATNYRFGIAQYIVLQRSGGVGTEYVGGSAATGTEQNPPRSFKPRCALLYNAANKLARRVTCFQNSAPLYTGAATTLQLYAGTSGEQFEFTRYGAEGERSRQRRS